MNKKISPIIHADELNQIRNFDNLILIDVSLGKDAKSNFKKSHLEGAIFVDLNTQLAEIKENVAQGGRHPLPSIENFSKTLGALGISKKNHIVLYDDNNGSLAAARFWWMLMAVGHSQVQVLNGGIQAAIKVNFPMSSEIRTYPATTPYPITDWQLPVAQIDEVEFFAKDKSHLVIDVRSPKRYDGIVEPIDLVAGHIPGAINVPFAENLDQNGMFLPPKMLFDKYSQLLRDVDNKNVVVHCGSGVTACHTLLAMAYAELEIPKLYVGSWSEWSRSGKVIE